MIIGPIFCFEDPGELARRLDSLRYVYPRNCPQTRQSTVPYANCPQTRQSAVPLSPAD